MNVTEQLADATRRWAQAKETVSKLEREMLELSKNVATEPEVLSVEARVERCRNAIQVQRERRGWSQRHLGVLLGFPKNAAQSRVSQIENGWRALTPGIFERTAQAFGMTTRELEATFSPTPPTPPSSRKQRIIEALRQSQGAPVTIAIACARAGCTTSDGYAEMVELESDDIVVPVMGGYVLKEQLARGVTRSEAA